MPAVSQQQQKLFGLALSVKRGETPRSEASEEVLNIVDSMSEKDIKDFAETSHSGLPSKVEQQMREALRELMREMAIEEAELPQATIPANIKTKLVQAIDKIKDTNLNYNQKLQVIGKIVDSLGIDKKELAKMSSKLKTTLESLNEADPCWKGYQQIGMKKKNGKEVPNCVPESIQEGKKRFNTKYGVGSSKYVISYHDGSKKHKDGSDFFDIQIFKNQKDLDTFKKALLQKGFIEESVNEAWASGPYVGIENTPTGPKLVKTFNSGSKAYAWVMKAGGGHSIMTQKQWNLEESVNEVASRTAMEIGGLTGMSKDFIQKFVDTHNLDIEKVFQFVKKGNLKDRMDFVTGLAGKPNNPYQTKLIKMFGESVNEDTKKRFEVDFYKGNGDRQTSHEEIIRGDKFSDVISQATKVAKSKGMNYVEFYYKDAFIGSIDRGNGYEFKKGRNSEKSPLSVNELKKLPNGNFSIKVGYPTFADYEKKAKTGDTILRYDKRGGMIKTFVNGSELDKNAERYLDKVNGIIGGVVFLTKKGMKGVAQVPDYEKKDIGVLVLESKSINEDFKAVVGKTIFSDGKGKLFFGYYKEDDSVYFVDYKTWAKLSMKDVSKSDMHKKQVLSTILNNQKQFNKKVDYNMWYKKTNPSFEQSMDYFMKNGFIGNITKAGIKVN